MLEAVVMVVAVIIDQLTKLWASSELVDTVVRVIPGVVNFRYVQNTGAAFGMFSGVTIILTVVTGLFICAMVFVIYKYKKKTTRIFNILISVIAGGAVGNFIDRVFTGYVVDFIEFDFVNFAVFNFADICVTVGAVILAVYALFFKEGKGLLKRLDDESSAKKKE